MRDQPGMAIHTCTYVYVHVYYAIVLEYHGISYGNTIMVAMPYIHVMPYLGTSSSLFIRQFTSEQLDQQRIPQIGYQMVAAASFQ